MKINGDLQVGETNQTLNSLFDRDTSSFVWGYCTGMSVPKEQYTPVIFRGSGNGNIEKTSNTTYTIKSNKIKRVIIEYNFLFSDWSSRTIYTAVKKNSDYIHRTYTKEQAHINSTTVTDVIYGDTISIDIYSSIAGTLNDLTPYAYITITAI